MMEQYFSPESKPQSIDTKRKSFSTETKRQKCETEHDNTIKCRRALQYGSKSELTLHECAKSGLTRLVEIPYTRNAAKMTNEAIKIYLVSSYGLIVDLHSEGKTLKGKFNSKNFIISVVNKKVKLHNVEVLSQSEGDAKKDKLQFVSIAKNLFGQEVPMDISVWLHYIKIGYPDSVLLHHINIIHMNGVFGQFAGMYHLMLKMQALDHRSYDKVLKKLHHYDSWQSRKFNWVVLRNNFDQQEYEQNAFGLTRLIRNTWEHPAKLYLKLLMPILLNEYKEFLSDVQLYLYEVGYLPQLDIFDIKVDTTETLSSIDKKISRSGEEKERANKLNKERRLAQARKNAAMLDE